MLNKLKSLLLIPAAFAAALISCENESIIGSSLTEGEVKIYVDSNFTFSGKSVEVKSFDSRSKHYLLGQLSAPNYGSITCKFVAQMMPATNMFIPDSITVERVDSMRLNLTMAKDYVTGDSLLPQQIRVYPLSSKLPSRIDNNFDPTGYFNPSNLLGQKSFTPTALGLRDSLRNLTSMNVAIKMPAAMGPEFFNRFRNQPSTFTGLQEFTSFFPGIYVEPAYGKGCVEAFSAARLTTYYYYYVTRTVLEDNKSVTKQVLIKDSINMAYTAPEMIAGNIVDYKPSESLINRIAQGECILASPSGYQVEINFPTQEILDRYWNEEHNMATINNLVFTLPVETIDAGYGLAPAPKLLMVKSKDLEEFFASNTLPDGKNAFWATYNDFTKSYTFSSMRDYIVDLMQQGSATVDPEDARFTLVPVYMQTEVGQYTKEEYVTVCTPYMLAPTICRLLLDKAKAVLTFSSQTIL